MFKKLTSGSKIGFVTPSEFIPKKKYEKIEKAIGLFHSLGLEIIWSQYSKTVDKWNVSSSSAQNRADDINTFFSDNNIDLIWAVRGGDTANEVIPYLDYELIQNNPKPFLGLSDISVILNAIYTQTGIFTFHASGPGVGNGEEYFGSDYTKNEFKKRFFEGSKRISKYSDRTSIRGGKAEGKLVGGNIRCLMKLAGTIYMPDFHNSILMLESLKSEPKHIVYLITQMKQMGIFDEINGLILGNFYQFDEIGQKDGEGKNLLAEDIILELTKEYDFPILKVNEFGHKIPNTFLPVGANVRLDATNLEYSIIDNLFIN